MKKITIFAIIFILLLAVFVSAQQPPGGAPPAAPAASVPAEKEVTSDNFAAYMSNNNQNNRNTDELARVIKAKPEILNTEANRNLIRDHVSRQTDRGEAAATLVTAAGVDNSAQLVAEMIKQPAASGSSATLSVADIETIYSEENAIADNQVIRQAILTRMSGMSLSDPKVTNSDARKMLAVLVEKEGLCYGDNNPAPAAGQQAATQSDSPPSCSAAITSGTSTFTYDSQNKDKNTLTINGATLQLNQPGLQGATIGKDGTITEMVPENVRQHKIKLTTAENGVSHEITVENVDSGNEIRVTTTSTGVTIHGEDVYIRDGTITPANSAYHLDNGDVAISSNSANLLTSTTFNTGTSYVTFDTSSTPKETGRITAASDVNNDGSHTYNAGFTLTKKANDYSLSGFGQIAGMELTSGTTTFKDVTTQSSMGTDGEVFFTATVSNTGSNIGQLTSLNIQHKQWGTSVQYAVDEAVTGGNTLECKYTLEGTSSSSIQLGGNKPTLNGPRAEITSCIYQSSAGSQFIVEGAAGNNVGKITKSYQAVTSEDADKKEGEEIKADLENIQGTVNLNLAQRMYTDRSNLNNPQVIGNDISISRSGESSGEIDLSTSSLAGNREIYEFTLNENGITTLSQRQSADSFNFGRLDNDDAVNRRTVFTVSDSEIPLSEGTSPVKATSTQIFTYQDFGVSDTNEVLFYSDSSGKTEKKSGPSDYTKLDNNLYTLFLKNIGSATTANAVQSAAQASEASKSKINERITALQAEISAIDTNLAAASTDAEKASLLAERMTLQQSVSTLQANLAKSSSQSRAAREASDEAAADRRSADRQALSAADSYVSGATSRLDNQAENTDASNLAATKTKIQTALAKGDYEEAYLYSSAAYEENKPSIWRRIFSIITFGLVSYHTDTSRELNNLKEYSRYMMMTSNLNTDNQYRTQYITKARTYLQGVSTTYQTSAAEGIASTGASGDLAYYYGTGNAVSSTTTAMGKVTTFDSERSSDGTTATTIALGNYGVTTSDVPSMCTSIINSNPSWASDWQSKQNTMTPEEYVNSRIINDESFTLPQSFTDASGTAHSLR